MKVFRFTVFLIFGVSLIGCDLGQEPGNCTQAKQLFVFSFEGKITEKYIWTENHGFRILKIRLPKNGMYKFICGWSSVHDDFFDYVQVGDSIKKNHNSLDVIITKSNEISKHFLINYNCPNMDFIEGD